MTNNPENMPDNIWAYPDTSQGLGGHYFTKPPPVDDGSDTVKYVRADLYNTIAEENKRLREALKLAKDCLKCGAFSDDSMSRINQTLNQTKGS